MKRFRSISILWLKCEEYEIECIKSDDITSLEDYNTNSGTYVHMGNEVRNDFMHVELSLLVI